jgi:hypothetical protein
MFYVSYLLSFPCSARWLILVGNAILSYQRWEFLDSCLLCGRQHQPVPRHYFAEWWGARSYLYQFSLIENSPYLNHILVGSLIWGPPEPHIFWTTDRVFLPPTAVRLCTLTLFDYDGFIGVVLSTVQYNTVQYCIDQHITHHD